MCMGDCVRSRATAMPPPPHPAAPAPPTPPLPSPSGEAQIRIQQGISAERVEAPPPSLPSVTLSHTPHLARPSPSPILIRGDPGPHPQGHVGGVEAAGGQRGGGRAALCAGRLLQLPVPPEAPGSVRQCPEVWNEQSEEQMSHIHILHQGMGAGRRLCDSGLRQGTSCRGLFAAEEHLCTGCLTVGCGRAI